MCYVVILYIIMLPFKIEIILWLLIMCRIRLKERFDIYYKAFTWIYNATDKIYYQDDFTMGNGFGIVCTTFTRIMISRIKRKDNESKRCYTIYLVLLRELLFQSSILRIVKLLRNDDDILLFRLRWYILPPEIFRLMKMYGRVCTVYLRWHSLVSMVSKGKDSINSYSSW